MLARSVLRWVRDEKGELLLGLSCMRLFRTVEQVKVAKRALSCLCRVVLQLDLMREQVGEGEGRAKTGPRRPHQVVLNHAIIGTLLSLDEVGGATGADGLANGKGCPHIRTFRFFHF